ncbi:MAG TPA: hypothetical protein VGO47_09845 [Chlamydiales bacterium]|nr:hypothetical protein [Chlamydiales bacterium]
MTVFSYQIGITEQKALYIHQISENRVNRSIMELFLNMIGKAFAKQAIFVTTMWNELSDDDVKEAAVREAMLLKSLFKDTRLQRFDCTSASASNILQEIITSTGNRSNLALQEELVDRGLHLSETMAGRCLYTQELALLHDRVKSAYDTSRKSLALGDVLAAEPEKKYERLKLELNRRFDKRAAIPLRWKMKGWFRCKFALVVDGTDLF